MLTANKSENYYGDIKTDDDESVNIGNYNLTVNSTDGSTPSANISININDWSAFKKAYPTFLAQMSDQIGIPCTVTLTESTSDSSE